MKLFSKTSRPAPGMPLPPPASLEAIEQSLEILRDKRAELEGKLGQVKATEAAFRADLAGLEDRLLNDGTADIESLRAARSAVLAATQDTAAATDELAGMQHLVGRAEKLVESRRVAEEQRQRCEMDHQYRRQLRRVAPLLAAAAVAMTELQELSDLAFSTYPFRSQPAAPPIFHDVQPLYVLTLRGRTRLVELLEAIKKHDGVIPEVQAAIDQATHWEAEQVAIIRRRDEQAAMRSMGPRFPRSEAPVSSTISATNKPDRVLVVAPPTYPERPTPLYQRTV